MLFLLFFRWFDDATQIRAREKVAKVITFRSISWTTVSGHFIELHQVLPVRPARILDKGWSVSDRLTPLWLFSMDLKTFQMQLGFINWTIKSYDKLTILIHPLAVKRKYLTIWKVKRFSVCEFFSDSKTIHELNLIHGKKCFIVGWPSL